MADFKLLFPEIIENEGLYSNDIGDAGGETVLGLTRVADASWSGWRLVDNYKEKPNFPDNLKSIKSELLELAYPFYKKKYWDVVRGDEINNQDIAEKIADTDVNTGNEAVKLAQRVAGLPETGNVDDTLINHLNNI